MKNRLVITGAGGFLGFHVLKYLCQNRYFQKIAALTSHAEDLKSRVETLPGKEIVEIYEAAAMKTGDVSLDEEDMILNCAYPRTMRGTDVTGGIDYVESVFQVAAASGIRGILNISSQSVYDPYRDHPATEEDVPFLYDEYSIGKYCIEVLFRNVCKNIPHTNIRLASLIGAGFNVRVPNKMVKHALDTGVINVEVNQQRFGYLDVEDAARGLVKIASTDPGQWEEIYNLGIDGTYTLAEMADIIQRKLLEMDKGYVEVIEHVSDSFSSSALCSNKVKSLIGEYVQNTLDKSIENIIKSFD